LEFAEKAVCGNLIHGPDIKTTVNSRQKKPAKPLDNVSENTLSERVAALERRMAALEMNLGLLASGVSPLDSENEDDEIEKKKPGPREKIDDINLVIYRDALILWLEPWWPWLESRLTPTAEDMRETLECVAQQENRADYQRRFIENAASLREFLQHERSGKKLAKATATDALKLPPDEKGYRAANQLPTRRIANAMAGVPDIGWRRSFDRCSAQPSRAFIALNLDMHLREKFDIAEPKGRDLTDAFCLLPKSLKQITQNAAGPETGRPIGVTATGSIPGGNENT
jgi:hypothetical protein